MKKLIKPTSIALIASFILLWACTAKLWEEPYYVGNRRTGVFHRPGCRYVKMMNPENKVYFHSREEAIRKGYRPCKICNP